MNNKDILTEFIDFLKDDEQKSLVKSYINTFKIEDLDAELSKLFAGEETET